MNAMLGFLFVFGGLLGAIIYVATFILWLWMLIDCIKNPSLSSNERIIWVLVIIFLPCLGSIIYFFAGRK